MDTLTQNLPPIRMRNYGRIIQNMVQYACTLTDVAQQQALVTYIAQCMRQKNMIWNKDQDSNWDRIRKDIATLSNGRLDCDFEGFDTPKYQNNRPNVQGKKKKK